MHGVMMVFFFLIPAIPVGARQLPRADHDRREGSRVPEAEPRELVHLHDRRGCSRLYAHGRPAASTPAGRSTRRSAPSRRPRNVIPAALGIFITGFSSILTGLNFIVTIHRMRAPGMTWFRLPLFIWSHYATSLIMVLGTPVHRDHDPAGRGRAALPLRLLRSGGRRRPGALPAPVLVLLAPGRLHHGAAGDGRDQRAGRRVLPQAGVRLHVRRVRQPRRSPCSASWSGATTCSSPASRSTRR